MECKRDGKDTSITISRRIHFLLEIDILFVHGQPMRTRTRTHNNVNEHLAQCGTKKMIDNAMIRYSHVCAGTQKLTDRVAIAAGVVKKLDEVVAGDDAGRDNVSEGGHLGDGGGGEQKVMARGGEVCG